jgi:DNA-binding LytR/AlgR family response regulator
LVLQCRIHNPESFVDARVATGSPLYLLERSDVDPVQLDRDLKVVAMNSFARRALPVEDTQPFEKIVLSFHPERSQAKVKFLIDQAECPVSNPPPMTMIINIPERVLLVKVSKMSDVRGDTAGYTLVFYDITDAVIREEIGVQRPDSKRQLLKIPTVASNRIVLVDAASVRYVRAEGHYTWVHTAQGSSFCNLNIGDLETRLDSNSFLRIHRSYVANLDFAEQIVRDDGKVMLKLQGDDRGLPVARTRVPRLLDAWASPKQLPASAEARGSAAGLSVAPRFVRVLADFMCQVAPFVHAAPACAPAVVMVSVRAVASRGPSFTAPSRATRRPQNDSRRFRLPRAALGLRRGQAARVTRARRQAAGRRPQPAADDEAALRDAQCADRFGQDRRAARHHAKRQRNPHRRDDHRAPVAHLQADRRQTAIVDRGCGLDRGPAGALPRHDRRRHFARRPG